MKTTIKRETDKVKSDNQKPIFTVYVEGSRHDEFKTYKAALKRAEKLESEGWNVEISKGGK